MRREFGGAALNADMTVLMSVAPPGPRTNPYIVQLTAGLSDVVGVRYFSWRNALFGRFDLFHAHWPEIALRGTTRFKTLARQALFAAFLVRLSVQRKPVVRTIHNLKPHEAVNPIEAWLLRRFDKRTRGWIYLNPVPETLAQTHQGIVRPGASSVILHGHYRDWLAKYPEQERIPGRLCFFGLIRQYKNVPTLIREFSKLIDSKLTLHVSGSANPAALADEVRQAARTDERVSVALEYISDEQLVQEVSQAELVVLPYREVYNSGAALMALSLNRPVLLPAGPSAQELAREVGSDWVLTFDGELTADAVEDALARAPRSGQPNLELREWPQQIAAHAQLYRDVRGAAPAPVTQAVAAWAGRPRRT